MHVLILANGYPSEYVPLDGIFNRDQAEALVNKTKQVGLISVNPISIMSVLQNKKIKFGKKAFKENGVDTITYKYINIPKFPTYCVWKAERKGFNLFKEYIKEFGLPDIIHVHCFEAGMLAIKIKKTYGIPFVVTEHSSRFLLNMLPNSLEKIAATVFNNAIVSLAVSENLRELLHKKYHVNFLFIPNIVDTAYFELKYPTVKSDFIFFNAAALNDNKNQHILIEAFSKFNIEYERGKLVIAGGGDLEKSLREQVRKLGIEKNVDFIGWVDRETLKEWYHQSQVFVLSSKKETFGVVLIEALSCGLPVISTKSGGPESIIKDTYLGELTACDSDGLYLAMKKVYDNFASYDSIKIRNFAVTNFSKEAVANQLIEVYNNILNSNK